jgi:replicative DNA helicase
MDRIEAIILRSLMYDEQYMRRVLPFLDTEYFLDRNERSIYGKIKTFVDDFNTLPTKEALIIDLNKQTGLDQDEFDEIVGYFNSLESEKDDKPHVDWLVERTEEWCQEKALHNAVLDAINIMDGKDKAKRTKGAIPKLLQDALGVSFDPHVGHDYLEDATQRYDFYHRVDTRIPFHLDYFNRVTKNGVPNKTLNICLAGVNVGKSLFMCDLASSYLMQNKNVLYITMEMAEERIAERIDANLMDRPVDELAFMSKEAYHKNIDRINKKTSGRLIIKEYATAAAHVGHFRHLLNELNLKKKFKPDAIFIDYLNICASSRVKASSGLYELVKSIAEELRGLAVEFNVPIWSATQMNRGGFNNSDPDLTNTSESFGLPATADFMFALVASEELDAMNQFMVKILKNRYGAKHMRNDQTGRMMNKFVVGVDRSKQKLFNVDESAQENIHQDDAGGGQQKAAPKTNGGRALPPAKPPVEDDDDTLPWDTKDPAYPVAEDSVFDIDRPTNERPYNEAEDEAERRRGATTKPPEAPYGSRRVMGEKRTKKNLKVE